jgi:hypothetical protein
MRRIFLMYITFNPPPLPAATFSALQVDVAAQYFSPYPLRLTPILIPIFAIKSRNFPLKR